MHYPAILFGQENQPCDKVWVLRVILCNFDIQVTRKDQLCVFECFFRCARKTTNLSHAKIQKQSWGFASHHGCYGWTSNWWFQQDFLFFPQGNLGCISFQFLEQIKDMPSQDHSDFTPPLDIYLVNMFLCKITNLFFSNKSSVKCP